MKTTLMGCVLILAAGVTSTTGPTAGAAESACPVQVRTSAPVHLKDPGRWSYTFQVSWCVRAGEITDITPNVTHEQDGSTCVWVGSVEESATRVPDGNGAWNSFNMSEFSCKGPDGKPGTVNPWGVVTIQPDGASSVLSKGIGDVIVQQ